MTQISLSNNINNNNDFTFVGSTSNTSNDKNISNTTSNQFNLILEILIQQIKKMICFQVYPIIIMIYLVF